LVARIINNTKDLVLNGCRLHGADRSFEKWYYRDMARKQNPNSLKNLRPPWKKGCPAPNPNGQKGKKGFSHKNYATLYKEALIKIGQLNNKEAAEIELQIISKGLLNAIQGDYRFYKDVLDRIHGTPVNKTQLTGEDGGAIQISGVKISVQR